MYYRIVCFAEAFKMVDMFRSERSVLSIEATEVGKAENYTSPTSEAPIDRTLRSDLNIPDHLKASAKHMIR